MSKRNFILLIIILSLAIIAVLGFLYSREGTPTTREGTEGTNFISRFSPFGNSKPAAPTETPPADIPGDEPGPGEETQKIKKVSSMPIAGFGVFVKERLKNATPPSLPLSGEGNSAPPAKGGSGGLKTEFVPALRYVERATGNIYQTFADKIEERKFSGTIIPKVYDAYFGNRGESVIMRYLKIDGKTIETFVGTLPRETPPPNLPLIKGEEKGGGLVEVKGSFLPDNIKDISVSPDTSKIFYLFNTGDSMLGTTLNLLNNKKVQVFDSSFTEWLSWWGNEKAITLSTKPSHNISGYTYTLDPTKKSLTKILGDINGLTALGSSDGKLILYGNNNLSLSVYYTDTRNSDILGVRTLPEKCVWNKTSEAVYCAVPKLVDAGPYPDAWYQGEVSFSDQLWKINVKNGNTTLLLDPVEITGGEEIDGIKLALDEGENYLFFVNKKDSFLWKLDLK